MGYHSNDNLEILVKKCVDNYNPSTEILIETILKIQKHLDIRNFWWEIILFCIDSSKIKKVKIIELSTFIVFKYLSENQTIIDHKIIQLIVDNLTNSD